MDRWDLLFVAGTLATIFIPLIIVLALVLSGKQWRAAQDMAHARRISEHRINARLLRLSI